MTLYKDAQAALNSLGLRPRKKWGQHFLVDHLVLRRIVTTAAVRPGDTLLEIGPGLGFLTAHLLDAGAEVWGIEIDPKLGGWLETQMRHPKFHLVIGDVLRCDLPKLAAGRTAKVIANLPYNISTAVIFKLLETTDMFHHLVLMLQREIAQRIVSPPGRKGYGTLSIVTQMAAEVHEEFHVAPTAFFPRPEVDSSLVTLKPKVPVELDANERNSLRAWVARMFSQRRKCLRNSFAHALPGLPSMEILTAAGVDPERRAETLTVDEIVRLHRLIRVRNARAAGS